MEWWPVRCQMSFKVGDLGVLLTQRVEALDTCSATSWLHITSMGYSNGRMSNIMTGGYPFSLLMSAMT